MNLFKGISNKIEGWLFKEEIAQQQSQPQSQQQSQSQPSPQQIEQLKEALEEIKQKTKDQYDHAKQEIDLVIAEDHSVNPTQSDIDRYFQYHTNFVSNVSNAQNNAGMWVTNKKDQIEKSDFDTKGRLEGWSFLRDSCGLPQGKLDAEPWKAPKVEGWSTK